MVKDPMLYKYTLGFQVTMHAFMYFNLRQMDVKSEKPYETLKRAAFFFSLYADTLYAISP